METSITCVLITEFDVLFILCIMIGIENDIICPGELFRNYGTYLVIDNKSDKDLRDFCFAVFNIFCAFWVNYVYTLFKYLAYN